MRILFSILTLSLIATVSFAVDSEEALDDPVLQARYEKIIDEVRCLKCQNTTIKDSNAFLAGDLRREIRHMLEDGLTDEQIFDFLVERYGDFALYNPRASGKTLILWIAPALFLLGGAYVLVNIVRRRMTLPIDDDSAAED
ncbi:MAG: cytochrome c-type biogenesis protein CcmH [Woeseiaceae bacterium]|jgi:cytochrome c-type biogenesis protein CcmH|nr:cytochrome c-type biogenesis protein CcmH [Woeseiaceae bacterium]